jgi:hypothetical protein
VPAGIFYLILLYLTPFRGQQLIFPHTCQNNTGNYFGWQWLIRIKMERHAGYFAAGQFTFHPLNQIRAHGIQAAILLIGANANQHVNVFKAMHLVTERFFGARHNIADQLVKFSQAWPEAGLMRQQVITEHLRLALFWITHCLFMVFSTKVFN